MQRLACFLDCRLVLLCLGKRCFQIPTGTRQNDNNQGKGNQSTMMNPMIKQGFGYVPCP